MKIAYIFIATGKYSVFIDGLVNSGIKNFFPEHETNFIVFTDSEVKDYGGKLIKINQNKLGWPYDTLKRFHLINSIENILNYDYIFFGNANMLFNEKVSIEILPTEVDNNLVGTKHCLFYDKPKKVLPYERNNKSKAFVDYGQEGDSYYQGCFFGGTKEAFLEMSKTLEKEIDVDLESNIIATWWDESHMNKYFIKKKPKEIDSGYSYPESMNIPFQKKIIQLDKNRLGGHNFLRN